MFELLKEMEKAQKRECTPVQLVQVVQSLVVNELEGAPPPGASWCDYTENGATTPKRTSDAPSRNQVAGHANTGLAPIAPVAPGVGAEIVKWPHPGRPLPRSRLTDFLVPCSFTLAMLERATDLWQAPIDSNDWRDIHAGHYLFENKEVALREYLYQWADDNPEKMAQLIKEFN